MSMKTTMISKVSTYNFGNLAEYIINAEIDGREFLLKVQEDREYRLYLGHPSNGPLDERRANEIKASLDADGITAEVDKDMYGNYFVRTPMAGNIYAGIHGYNLVKNVIEADGHEHCGQNYLFAVRCNCKGDYLNALVEVCENTNENYEYMSAKYPWSNEEYHLWFGTIVPSRTEGKDEIMFYWS